jgi:FkbM family methyltransferase
MIHPINKLSDFGISVKGVIHVGAHYGQEYQEYDEGGISNMIFFEPLQANYDKLIQLIPSSVKTFRIALGNETGQREMFVEKSNLSMSSSILEPVKHLEQYPWITFDYRETVSIDKLDNIEFDRGLYNVLNIDVQGFELNVLKGAVETLKTIDAIYIELNAVEMYKGCALVGEIDSFLSNFKRVLDNVGTNNWGEGLYIRC